MSHRICHAVDDVNLAILTTIACRMLDIPALLLSQDPRCRSAVEEILALCHAHTTWRGSGADPPGVVGDPAEDDANPLFASAINYLILSRKCANPVLHP